MADLDGVAKEYSFCSEHKAREDHVCSSCGGMIKKSERYKRTTFRPGGTHWKAQKTCLACAAACKDVRVVFVGLKLGRPRSPDYRIVCDVMTAVEGCFEAWGVKDPEPELQQLRKERSELMAAWNKSQQEVINLKRRIAILEQDEKHHLEIRHELQAEIARLRG